MRATILPALLTWVALHAAPLAAQTPTVADALKLRPVQPDVKYDIPEPDQVSSCTIQVQTQGKRSGWVVRDPQGVVLRQFWDTNADNVVDQWCYFRGGLEVYRDIDSDFDGKAEQFRWFHTAGTRWGLDQNGDGRIDHWKQISPEELSREVVLALAQRDKQRFLALLATKEELRQLGIKDPVLEQLLAKLQSAPGEFERLIQHRVLSADATWLQFSAQMPGLIPAGTPGVEKDLVVYENALVLAEQNGQTIQLDLGTLIRVEGGWRLLSAPKRLDNDPSATSSVGVFFRTSHSAPAPVASTTPQVDPRYQKLLTQLESLERQLATAPMGQKAALHQRRARVLRQLAQRAPGARERTAWLQQLADTVSVAAQNGEFPQGLELLEELLKEVSAQRSDSLAAYVHFRLITAQYNRQLQASGADFAKVQKWWLGELQQFVRRYPKSPDTAEALLQLGIAQEFAGQEQEARQWYTQVLRRFPRSAAATKAQGALRRLDSVGRVLALSGTTLQGRRLDLAQLRGRVVLVHYWASWCEPCVQDMKVIAQLYAKYGPRGFQPLGVCLDRSQSDALAVLRRQGIAWPQLHEPGGLDGPLANHLGVLTLPTMLLLDRQGKVIHRNIHAAELESELKKHLGRPGK